MVQREIKRGSKFVKKIKRATKMKKKK